MERSPDAATSGAGGGRGLPWRAAGAVLVAVTFLIGLSLMVMSATIAAPDAPLRPPQPDPAAAPPGLLSTPPPNEATGLAPDASPDGGPPDQAFAPVGMARSLPTRVRIPRIGVNAEIMRLGVDQTGQIEVPPLEEAHLAGWYGLGPSPGEIGSAVVVGHVDSYATGPAVFFELGALKPGDEVEIARKDGEVAKFVVDGVASYPKEEFPTALVYGSTGRAELRLVTCGGVFDSRERDYRDNVIVFASLVTEPME